MIGVEEETITSWERAFATPSHYRKDKELCEVLGLNYREALEKFCPICNGSNQPFGKQILEARILKGLTQEQVARDVGIDPQH